MYFSIWAESHQDKMTFEFYWKAPECVNVLLWQQGQKPNLWLAEVFWGEKE